MRRRESSHWWTSRWSGNRVGSRPIGRRRRWRRRRASRPRSVTAPDGERVDDWTGAIAPVNRVITRPVVDAIAATLDGLGSRDVRRLYVKAPEAARLETFQAIVAREVRARGFIPLSASVVGASPAIAPLLASRSIVLFGDARCAALQPLRRLQRVARGVDRATAACRASLQRTASVVAAIVARVCDHVNVAALRLMPAAAASTPRAAFALRPRRLRSGRRRRQHPSEPSGPSTRRPPFVESAWPPQSVVQPAWPVSYADPDLPSLFPRTDQIAQVAETAVLAPFAVRRCTTFGRCIRRRREPRIAASED